MDRDLISSRSTCLARKPPASLSGRSDLYDELLPHVSLGPHPLGGLRKERRQQHRGSVGPGGGGALAPAGSGARCRLRPGPVHSRACSPRLEATGIDYVPSAIEAARSKGVEGVTYVVGDATDLAGAGLPTFDFFFDVGCFQGF